MVVVLWYMNFKGGHFMTYEFSLLTRRMGLMTIFLPI